MQKIGAILMLPIYTQFLTTHEYGLKELVGISTDVIAILLASALSGSFYRFYFAYDDEDEKKEVVSTILLAVGGIGLIAVALLAFTTKKMAGVILDDPSLYHYFLISFASLWFQTLNGIGYSFLKANKKSYKFVFLSLIKMVLVIGLNIYFVAFLKIGVVGVLISTLIAAIIITIILIVPLFIDVGLGFSLKKLREILKFGLPIIPAQFGAFIVHLSDRFFIKEYASIAEAGIYSLGYRFGALPANFISDPFNQIFQPKRMEIYKKKDASYLFGKIFTYYLVIMAFAALIVAILTKEVLMIMANQEFWAAYEIVPIIVLATTIFSFHYHLDVGIIMAKKTKYLAYVNLSNAALVIVLNFLLIPPYGVYGAAWATLIAFIYKGVLTYYFSSRYFKVSFEITRLLKLTIIVVLIYAGADLIQIESPYTSFIVRTLYIFAVYPLLMHLFGFFSQAERKMIVETIKNRKLTGFS